MRHIVLIVNNPSANSRLAIQKLRETLCTGARGKGLRTNKKTQPGIPCLHCTLNWYCWRVISTMQTSAYQDMYNIIPQVRASPLNTAPSNVMTAINLWETLIFYILRIKQLVPFPDEQASWPSLFPNCLTLCFNALMPTCNMAFNSGALLHIRTHTN